MKNQIKKQLILMVLCLCAFTLLSAMKRVGSSRAGQSYMGKYVRPNSKSSLRYYTVTPNRACITGTKVATPSAGKAFIPKRELSISQIGSGLLKKAQWSLTSRENKKIELFRSLRNNIGNENADRSLFSIIKLFTSENLINEPMSSGALLTGSKITPLEFAIKYSNNKSNSYQKALVEILVENGAQLHGAQELEFALEHNNLGAIRTLIPYSSETTAFDFFSKVKNKLSSKKELLQNILSAIANKKEPIEKSHLKILLEELGKTYAKTAKLKKILDLRPKLPKLLDLSQDEKEMELK